MGKRIERFLDKVISRRVERRLRIQQERETAEKTAAAIKAINERNTELVRQGKRPVILGEFGDYGFF